ncbi:hypothetical protein GCM10023321_51960 [Pseudonocardia eucalypti]|uniref:Uncharacterized protein n=1 Tax=Pseudonocardia eucalypti TaxID=648755 RepID=A0ABP9QLR6_9PSEU|nr:hypothetical protein [Pseudonocardia eucalypti]
MTALDELARVADAVLFEGYLLYPYRASAQKNRLRWQFGVLVPPGYAEESGEAAANRTECLLEAGPATALHVRLRFLRLRARSVYDADGRPIDHLVVDGTRVFAWEEGQPATVDAVVAVGELLAGPRAVSFALSADLEVEPVAGGSVHRRCWPLAGRLVLSATELPGPYGALRLRLDVLNDSQCPPEARREEALRTSLIAAHSLLSLDAGSFLSPTDPPEWAKPATAELTNEHTWPVLGGPEDRSDLLLSSPIILADHPRLAPESPTDLFDGTEIDEILSLRTLVLTDEEKAEARATDPKAAAVIDAVDGMPPEIWERLHGAVRSLGPSRTDPTEVPPWEQPEVPWWDPGVDESVSPETDSVLVGSVQVRKGVAVRLRPRGGGDAQDTFLVGLRATVQAVLHDVDGEVHVAVSLDDDPAAELQLAHGRYRYFRPDELEPVRVS